MTEVNHRIGLSWFEVEQRRKCRPSNSPSTENIRFWWRLFLEKFDDPLIRLLAVTALISFLVGLPHGEILEGSAVLIMILAVTLLGLIGEWLALRQFTHSLDELEQNWFTAIRGGEAVSVPVADLVPDDCIVLEAGDRIPAEGFVLDAIDFRVEPPLALATESTPTNSDSHQPRAGMVVTEGRALWKITSWPDLPAKNRILENAWRVDRSTPLWQQTEAFVGWFPPIAIIFGLTLLVILGFGNISGVSAALPRGSFWLLGSIGAGLAISFASWWLPAVYRAAAGLGFEVSTATPFHEGSCKSYTNAQKLGFLVTALLLFIGIAGDLLPADPRSWMTNAGLRALLDMAMLVLAVLVAVVPDGLGMHIVLGLLWTIRQMAKEGLRVRRLNVAEKLAGIELICHDIHGTMTKLKPHVKQIYVGIQPAMPSSLKSLSENRLWDAIATTSYDSRICRPPGQEPIILGEPTSGALLLWLQENGFSIPKDKYLNMKRLSGPPGWKVVLAELSTDNTQWLFVQGPAAAVAKCCNSVEPAPCNLNFNSNSNTNTNSNSQNLCSFDLSEVIKFCEQANSRGEILLGFAATPYVEGNVSLQDLRWLGAATLHDFPAEDYLKTYQTLSQAGIEVAILSDLPGMVIRNAIAEHGKVLLEKPPIILGLQTDTNDDVVAKSSQEAKMRELAEKAQGSTRAQIVRRIRESGKRVATLGWRLEDIPVLVESNVAVAIGATAPPRVREACDAVILESSLQSSLQPLVRAISYGRAFFRNIRRYLLFQSVVNGLILGASLLGPLFGMGFPLTVMQMLWVHFLHDMVGALALATESPDPDLLDGPPLDVTRPLLTREIVLTIIFQSLLGLCGFLLWQFWLASSGISIGLVRSFTFTTFVFLILWVMWMSRWFGARILHANRAWDNSWFTALMAGAVITQMVLVQIAGEIFQSTPLTGWEWLALLAGTGIFVWIIAHLSAWLTRRIINCNYALY